ncbi:MAG TPA: VOC family protein [Thermoanaerobaculaceae bacterium]|nr:VOC family protein [Thermoanaerobaculaceae bacterium]
MAKVLGIGGVFVKSRDARKLRRWYSRWLGTPVGPTGVMFAPKAMPKGAVTVLALFPATTRYFSPSRSAVMVNFVVDDAGAMLERAADGGGRVVGTVRGSPYGRFGWFIDPDGNKVELWEPPGAKAKPRSGGRKRRSATGRS